MKVVKDTPLYWLIDGCKHLGLEVPDEGFSKLDVYLNELLLWSKRINLIAKKQNPKQIIENHFLDSLMLLSIIGTNGYSLVDVGSGAGFPGLVCKAVLPELKVILIEPRQKRVSFLRHVVRTLKLSDVEILAERTENIHPGSLSCSSITSRAVAEIGDFLQMIQHLVDSNTRIICMKGPKWKEEISSATPFLKEFNLELTQINEFILPFSGAERALLGFTKIKSQ